MVIEMSISDEHEKRVVSFGTCTHAELAQLWYDARSGISLLRQRSIGLVFDVVGVVKVAENKVPSC